jgi:hypothetical protein
VAGCDVEKNYEPAPEIVPQSLLSNATWLRRSLVARRMFDPSNVSRIRSRQAAFYRVLWRRSGIFNDARVENSPIEWKTASNEVQTNSKQRGDRQMPQKPTASIFFKLFLLPIFFLIAAGVVRNTGYGFVKSDEPAANKTMALPRYTADKNLVMPEGYHNWVFVGASIGLSYSEESRGAGPGLFHNVYTQPEAYAEYLRTGKFPEKSMFVMEVYQPEQKVSPNKNGYFEGQRAAVEVSVKDRETFPEGWAYFNFGNGRRTEARPIPKASCFECHHEHGADDNVFVQFYPALRDVKKSGSTPRCARRNP